MARPEQASGRRPRVAILIVNGFARRGRFGPQRVAEALEYPWIDLCLSQIERHSAGWDYQVLAFDNTHFRAHRRLIRAHQRVRLMPNPLIAALGRIANRIPSERVGRLFELRHPRALDHLAAKAGSDFEYLVTLDNDSFPVREDWLDVLVTACEEGAAVAGVYRDEMAPTIHPFVHVSGLCVRRADLRELNVSFGRDIRYDVDYTKDVEYNQDVGQKITYEFLRRGRTIGRLERSNKRNFHFLMGGIYGDVIYHHGAGSRRAKFRKAGDVETNQEISDGLRDASFHDLDHLIAVLRGEVANDLALAPLQ